MLRTESLESRTIGKQLSIPEDIIGNTPKPSVTETSEQKITSTSDSNKADMDQTTRTIPEYKLFRCQCLRAVFQTRLETML